VNIVVLVKQVPDTESLLEVDTANATVNTQNVKWIINPYDEYAIEEALQIKAAKGEGSVTVVGVGPNRSEQALRTALAMGADTAVLVNDPAAEGSDALGTAKILAAVVKEMDYDLVIAGVRAVDDDGYQVPAALAEYLDLPLVTAVIKEELDEGKITCHQLVESGSLVVEAPLPMIFTAQKGLNEPRYASLPNIMKAKKKPLEKKSLADIGVDAATIGGGAAKVAVSALALPPERKGGKMVAGDTPAALAAELVRLLKEEAEVL
jgi:electron transfer flavoprotein beta subunit